MNRKMTAGLLAECLTDHIKSFIDAYIAEKFTASDDGDESIKLFAVAIQDTLLDLIDKKIEDYHKR